MKKQIIIALTGTPGVGKTSVARLLSKNGFLIIPLNMMIVKNKLYSGYDKKRKCHIADMKKIRKFINKIKKENPKKNIIIDSHLSHFLPVNVSIVLRCKPDVLRERLKKKRWSREKIEENLEAEFLDIISIEAKNKIEINTTKLTKEQVARKIFRILKKKNIEILLS